ncbi:hypothetical protein TNCV_2551641 [Trichonephila clavipes]|nr:hypothetical protein TNCV_2551641 [Trichonephila clavipes]
MLQENPNTLKKILRNIETPSITDTRIRILNRKFPRYSVANHLYRYVNTFTIALPDSKNLIEMQNKDEILNDIIKKINQNDVSPRLSSYFINEEASLSRGSIKKCGGLRSGDNGGCSSIRNTFPAFLKTVEALVHTLHG